jgi:hypothetical protein
MAAGKEGTVDPRLTRAPIIRGPDGTEPSYRHPIKPPDQVSEPPERGRESSTQLLVQIESIQVESATCSHLTVVIRASSPPMPELPGQRMLVLGEVTVTVTERLTSETRTHTVTLDGPVTTAVLKWEDASPRDVRREFGVELDGYVDSITIDCVEEQAGLRLLPEGLRTRVVRPIIRSK